MRTTGGDVRGVCACTASPALTVYVFFYVLAPLLGCLAWLTDEAA